MKLSVGQKIFVAILCVVIGLATTAYAINFFLQHHEGNITGINIEVLPATITWTDITLSSINTRTFTVKNTGTEPITIIWTGTPQIGTTLSWDYDDIAIAPAETRTITWTLTVDPSANPGSFSFDVTITATAI